MDNITKVPNYPLLPPRIDDDDGQQLIKSLIKMQGDNAIAINKLIKAVGEIDTRLKGHGI